MAPKKQALVVGGLGVVGRTLLNHLAETPDWDVIGLSRRSPEFETSARFISVDLLDRMQAQAKLSDLTEVTHIFYAGLSGGLASENVADNLALLANTVDAVAPVAPRLEHISLMQGGKAYGRHLGAFKTPARESDPRHPSPNFYYDQEDFLRRRCENSTWTWSALRPELVCGFARGVPLNLILLLAAYAAVSRELGLPLRFPGTKKAYGVLGQLTDAALLARATTWAATDPRCHDQIFNLTNGDCFRWENLWPKLAEFFGMPCDASEPFSIASFMADKEPVWDAIVARCGLQPIPFAELGNWPFMDWVFATDWDYLMSDVKRMQCGFTEVIDTEQMCLDILADFRRDRVIP